MDTATGEHNVDPVSRQAALEAKGMSPAEAQAASTSGLRKVTQADQQSYSASVYLEGGHKYLREYNDAIKSAATERSNQVRRDVNRASTMDDVSKAYGHIDDGKSIRSVPQMDDKGKPTGKFQIEKFDTGTGRAVGLLQAGKVFDSMDQLKADINVSMNENPDVFVAHEQAQAQRAMEERKLAEESRKNKANEGLHAESNKTAKQQAGTAELAQQSTAKANAASAGLHTAQTDVVKGGLALDKAYQTDESLRTPEQTAMLKGAAQKATDQAIAKARHPDAVLAARAVATKDVNTYLNNSKTALTNYGTSEVQQRAAFTHISQQLLHGINDADSIGRFDVVTEAHKILDRAVELQKSGNKGTIDQIAVGLIKQPTVPAAAAGAAPAAVGATTPAPDDATKYRHLYQNKQ
jgi:hypothetical protein